MPIPLNQLIAGSALFAGLSSTEVSEAATRFKQVRYGKGETIYNRGDTGSALYLIEAGQIRFSLLTAEGRELTVRLAGPGDLIGELAVFDGDVRSATATTLNEVNAWSLSKSAFDGLLDRMPALNGQVIKFLCRRIRDTTDQLESIALYPIEVRLARLLLAFSDGGAGTPNQMTPVKLSVSQTELSQMIGASRPKLNGALNLLEAEGVVERRQGQLFCIRSLLLRFADTLEQR